MRKVAPAVIISLACALFVAGCGCSARQGASTTASINPEVEAEVEGSALDDPEAEEDLQQADDPVESGQDEQAPAETSLDEESVAETVDTGVTIGADTLERLVGWGISTWGTISDTASDQLEARRSAVPTHAALGEEVAATENLSVTVVSVEEGPYDYLDRTPTTMVTVRMRNTSDHVVTVKASNWDADTASGLRVDHKYVVVGEDNHVAAQSFTVARISPGATYEACVYFDGDALVSVIYEPHWLVSAENEYVYFDL